MTNRRLFRLDQTLSWTRNQTLAPRTDRVMP